MTLDLIRYGVSMTIESIILLFLIGVVVGFINIISAGGSLLSLPALIFFGIPSTMANGTNRVAIIIQNLSAMVEFYKKGMINWRLSLLLAIPAVIGSLIGAQYAITLPEDIFNRILAIVMITVLILMFTKPHQFIKSEKTALTTKKIIALMIIFLVIGFYGGFIQAGVGFLIIATLTIFLHKMPLVEMHSVKTVVIAIYLICSLIVFISYDQIHWGYALVLALGGGVGGWAGSRFAIRIPEFWLKWTMIIIISLMAIGLFLR